MLVIFHHSLFIATHNKLIPIFLLTVILNFNIIHITMAVVRNAKLVSITYASWFIQRLVNSWISQTWYAHATS